MLSPLILDKLSNLVRGETFDFLKSFLNLGFPLRVEVFTSKIKRHGLVGRLPNVWYFVVENNVPEKEAKKSFAEAILAVHAFEVMMKGKIPQS